MAFDLDDEENKATRKMNGASKERKEENMDIEVGEYVRVKEWNAIGKILKITVSRIYIDSLGFGLTREQTHKHSKDIIDLIEVGDLIKSKEDERIIHIFNTEMLKALKEDIENGDITIETVATNEQFESIEYKVEEDK